MFSDLFYHSNLVTALCQTGISPQLDEETKACLNHLFKVIDRVEVITQAIIPTKLRLTYTLIFVCLEDLLLWHMTNSCMKSKSKQGRKKKKNKKNPSTQFALSE